MDRLLAVVGQGPTLYNQPLGHLCRILRVLKRFEFDADSFGRLAKGPRVERQFVADVIVMADRREPIVKAQAILVREIDGQFPPLLFVVKPLFYRHPFQVLGENLLAVA